MVDVRMNGLNIQVGQQKTSINVIHHSPCRSSFHISVQENIKAKMLAQR